MTEQKIIENALKKVTAQQDNLGGFMERFNIQEHWTVREALEKQIAKKPIKNNPIKNKAWSKSAMLCPICNEYVSVYGDKYCESCGQKLDWE